MLVALCRFDLRIPGMASLKEKRHVVKTLTGSLRQRFNVAVAEVDHQDLWQRAAIAVSAVAGDGYHLKRVMHEVERHIDRWDEVEIIDVELSLHGPDD
ncbi:MAG: DUF503 domain-containing protein [Actinobacteria bacterium]|nr:MAG: DUF503 domain-containing protein [Actinomycetota bacterium]